MLFYNLKINLKRFYITITTVMPKVCIKNSTPVVPDPLVECCICLNKKPTINQPCGLNDHRICKSCISSIIKTIPISENKPDISCQYPFEDCNEVYSKTFIKSVLGERYQIYKIARDKYTYFECTVVDCPGCNMVLVYEGEIDLGYIYECVYCMKAYCFQCGIQGKDCENYCKVCKGFDIINPYAYNYFFYKENNRANISDYLIQNKDIDPNLACKQIITKMTDMSVRCPVCCIPIQRSEQCNSLKHCHVEICYNCGEFSKIGEGLGDHWSARGHGCARWETDTIYNQLTPTFICKEGECYSHDSGDCKDKLHAYGRDQYNNFKKNQYMYHSLKSLLPRIRYKVIDLLPDNLEEFLPSQDVLDFIDCNSDFEDIQKHMNIDTS